MGVSNAVGDAVSNAVSRAVGDAVSKAVSDASIRISEAVFVDAGVLAGDPVEEKPAAAQGLLVVAGLFLG